jgi:hypothetical protein
MTIIEVVLGVGTPEGCCGEGSWVCASTDAAGSRDIRKGTSSFMVYLDSVWLLVAGSVGLGLKGDPIHHSVRD